MEDTLLYAIRNLDSKLDAVLKRLDDKEKSEWVDRKEALRILGIGANKMTELIADGTFGRDCCRNVGTHRKPRWAFHRERAFQAYLNRY